MKLDILQYPHPLLLTKLKKVKKSDYSEALDWAKKMKSTIQFRGIGLAANQVGYDKRLIIVKLTNKGSYVMINPKIIRSSGQTSISEACLSIQGKSVKIKRYKDIDVEFINEQLKKEMLSLNGIESICVQHEIDHLNGITLMNNKNKEPSMISKIVKLFE